MKFGSVFVLVTVASAFALLAQAAPVARITTTTSERISSVIPPHLKEESQLRSRVVPPALPYIWTKEFMDTLGDLKGARLSLKPNEPYPIVTSPKDLRIDPASFWLARQRQPPPTLNYEPSFMRTPIPEPTPEQLAWAARYRRTWQDVKQEQASNSAVLNSIAKELPSLNNEPAIRQYLASLPGASRQHRGSD